MALDFPNSPTSGQIFTVGNANWQWDTVKWVAVTTANTPLPILNGGTGAVTASAALANLGGAPIANPTFTGLVGIPALTSTGAVNLNGAPNNIKGVTDGSGAAAGQVGEFISQSGSAITLTSGAVYDLTTVTLQPGDWDVWGTVYFPPSAGASTLIGSISSTSGVLQAPYNQVSAATASIGTTYMVLPTIRVSISVATAYRVVGQANFASGTCTGTGIFNARRVR